MTSHRASFFDSLFGFPEESSSYGTTQQKLLGVARFASEPSPFYYRERCDFVLSSAEQQHRGGDRVASAGIFSVPSVAELHRHVQHALRDATKDIEQLEGGSSVRVQNIVGEARSIHTEPQNVNAVVQAASQFNLLEMPGPYDTPEDGIAGYEHDHTQGPACAIACAAGTAYRNYLVPVPFVEPAEESSSHAVASVERRGQTSHNQINTLEDIEAYLRDVHGIDEPWQVRNGYVESSPDALAPLNGLLKRDPTVSTELIQRLRIGVQEQCHVTDAPALDNDVRVTQTYNSAVSIGYSRLPSELWESMARLVLNGTYEATLLVGVLESMRAIQERRDVPPVLLTMVGGGVFKNKGRGSSRRWNGP